MKLFEIMGHGINKMTDEEKVNFVLTNHSPVAALELLTKPSSAVRLAILKGKYWLISYMGGPTEDEQMVCIDGLVNDYDRGRIGYVYIAVHDQNGVCAVWDDTGEIMTLFEHPTVNVIKRLLSEPVFINATRHNLYDRFVQEYFKDNTVLMNKWLRYAQNMREMK